MPNFCCGKASFLYRLISFYCVLMGVYPFFNSQDQTLKMAHKHTIHHSSCNKRNSMLAVVLFDYLCPSKCYYISIYHLQEREMKHSEPCYCLLEGAQC